MLSQQANFEIVLLQDVAMSLLFFIFYPIS